jgi:hypothetical protein
MAGIDWDRDNAASIHKIRVEYRASDPWTEPVELFQNSEK